MCVDAAYPTSRPVITSGPSSASGSYLQSHGKVRRTRFLTRWRSWRLRALCFSMSSTPEQAGLPCCFLSRCLVARACMETRSGPRSVVPRK
jgi:hypothetical protein